MAKGTCSVVEDGVRCGGLAWARGWCHAHLRRFYAYGDPLGKPPPLPTAEQRFWAKVDKAGSAPAYRPELGPCWLWTAQLVGRGDARYGKFNYPGGQLAHRFAHELLVGPIPPGLQCDHLCRNPGCVKVIADEHGPAHLELVTPKENCLRGESFAAINARKTHCPRGHPLDGDNLYRHPDGRRECRECARTASREYQRRRRARLRAEGASR